MNKSKNLQRVIAALLAVCCVAALLFCVKSANEALDNKSSWEHIREEALDSFLMMENGINQLAENEETYLEGLETYLQGLDDYSSGEKKVEIGAQVLSDSQLAYEQGLAAYADGEEKLAAGYREYRAGLAELEAGKAEVAAGEATLAENAQAYEEGKAQLAQVEPIYNAIIPIYQEYLAAQARYEQAMKGNNMEAILQAGHDVAALWVTLNFELGDYSLQKIMDEYEAGQAKIAEYEEGVRQVEEGKAKIAAGEEKLARAADLLYVNDQKLAEAKETLDAAPEKLADGEKELEAGKEALAEGAASLESGRSQLAVFEDGQSQIRDGVATALATETYFDKNGTPIVKSIADRMGAGFDYINKDVTMVDGTHPVKTEAVRNLISNGRAFVEDTTEAVTAEITGRFMAIISIVIATVVGAVCIGLMLTPKTAKFAPVALIAETIVALVAAGSFIVERASGLPLSAHVGAKGDLALLVCSIVLAVIAAVGAVVCFSRSAAEAEK